MKHAETSPFRFPEMIDKFLKYMENIKSASPLTIRHYRLDLTQTFFDENRSQYQNITNQDDLLRLARLAFNRWAPLSLASRNRKAATLKSFFGYLFDQKLIESDLSLQITCPKAPRKIPHFISVDEVISVLKSFETTNTGTSKEKLLFLLLYGGGLRVSEACNLKWKDILSNGAFRVVGKGNKERIIVAPEIVRNNLKSWRQQHSGTEFIFGNQPLNTRTAYEIIRQAGKRAGLIQPLHPHALRHSFATHMLTSGANLRTLQELLGHESLRATEKYTHLGIDQLARTMEALHPLGSKK